MVRLIFLIFADENFTGGQKDALVETGPKSFWLQTFSNKFFNHDFSVQKLGISFGASWIKLRVHITAVLHTS